MHTSPFNRSALRSLHFLERILSSSSSFVAFVSSISFFFSWLLLLWRTARTGGPEVMWRRSSGRSTLTSKRSCSRIPPSTSPTRPGNGSTRYESVTLLPISALAFCYLRAFGRFLGDLSSGMTEGLLGFEILIALLDWPYTEFNFPFVLLLRKLKYFLVVRFLLWSMILPCCISAIDLMHIYTPKISDSWSGSSSTYIHQRFLILDLVVLVFFFLLINVSKFYLCWYFMWF